MQLGFKPNGTNAVDANFQRGVANESWKGSFTWNTPDPSFTYRIRQQLCLPYLVLFLLTSWIQSTTKTAFRVLFHPGTRKGQLSHYLSPCLNWTYICLGWLHFDQAILLHLLPVRRSCVGYGTTKYLWFTPKCTQLSRRVLHIVRFSLSVWLQPMTSFLPSVSVRVHRFHVGRPANGRPGARPASANLPAVAMLEADSISERSPPPLTPLPASTLPSLFFSSSHYSRLIGCRQKTL